MTAPRLTLLLLALLALAGCDFTGEVFHDGETCAPDALLGRWVAGRSADSDREEVYQVEPMIGGIRIVHRGRGPDLDLYGRVFRIAGTTYVQISVYAGRNTLMRLAPGADQGEVRIFRLDEDRLERRFGKKPLLTAAEIRLAIDEGAELFSPAPEDGSPLRKLVAH